MKIITEIDLREGYKKNPFESYRLEALARMTPAAVEFLNERKIKIVDESGEPVLGSQHRRIENEADKCLTNARVNILKPEELTHLHGSKLVLKTHERIKFRGKLDSLQAFLIGLIIESQSARNPRISQELTQLLAYLRKMMQAEVMEKPLDFIDFYGWDDNEIRNRSHHPKEYYGVGHFTPDPCHGPVMAGLNQLRTKVRELEIAGIAALLIKEQDGLPRHDIILALNRLSSLVYIMMCQYLGGIYEQEEAGK